MASQVSIPSFLSSKPIVPTRWCCSTITCLKLPRPQACNASLLQNGEWVLWRTRRSIYSVRNYKYGELCLNSGLECTRFFVGMFMNYLGQSCPADRREDALAGLEDDLMLDFINIEAGHALVPVTSDGQPCRLSLCEINDVGKLVAAALDLENWEDE